MSCMRLRFVHLCGSFGLPAVLDEIGKPPERELRNI